MDYDRSYDMASMASAGISRAPTPLAGGIAMPSNDLQTSCEGRDLNPDALRRQILSLKPSPSESSSETSDFATHARRSPSIDGRTTTDSTTRHPEERKPARGVERCRLCGIPETVQMIAGHPLCAFCLERIAAIAADAERKLEAVGR